MKNKKSSFKNLSVASVAISALALANFSFAAAASPAAPADSSMIVAAINDLDQNMQKLAYANAASKNSNDYQNSPSLAQAAQVNTAKSQAHLQEYPGAQGVSAITTQNAANKTQNQNINALTEFSDAALTYNALTDDVTASLARNKKRQKMDNTLSWKTKASDSLYTDLATASPDVQKPITLHDNYFNFSSLIQPTTYTADQETAAHKFIAYLSQRFESLSDGIDFGKLRTYLLTLQNKPEKLNAAIKSFATSSSYEKYQLTAREMIAQRSVALNNFNELAAERSPITTTQANPDLAQLSQAIGVSPSTSKDPKTGQTLYIYASPLQISNFVTTHRTSSPQWYQQMMAASRANVQRETLFILAEMETEMQRQHLDNERLLATLSASQLQNVTAETANLKGMTNDINQQIATLSGNGNTSAVQPLNPPGGNNSGGNNSQSGGNNNSQNPFGGSGNSQNPFGGGSSSK